MVASDSLAVYVFVNVSCVHVCVRVGGACIYVRMYTYASVLVSVLVSMSGCLRAGRAGLVCRRQRCVRGRGLRVEA